MKVVSFRDPDGSVSKSWHLFFFLPPTPRQNTSTERILYEVWAAYIWSVLLLMTSVSHPFPKAEVTVERKTDR